MKKKTTPQLQKLVNRNSRGIEEYVILISKKEDKKIYSIFASNNETWNEEVRGKRLMKITVQGDFIKISKKYKKINFAEAQYLRILLNLESHFCKASSLVTFTDVNGKNPIAV